METGGFSISTPDWLSGPCLRRQARRRGAARSHAGRPDRSVTFVGPPAGRYWRSGAAGDGRWLLIARYSADGR